MIHGSQLLSSKINLPPLGSEFDSKVHSDGSCTLLASKSVDLISIFIKYSLKFPGVLGFWGFGVLG